jgi:hypothetical protein
MTIDDLKATANATALPPLLRALWHDAQGEWEDAHQLAQEVDDADGAWVHAYLHRKEGDAGNAEYWYSRANQPVATDSLPAEWERIAAALLNRKPART